MQPLAVHGRGKVGSPESVITTGRPGKSLTILKSRRAAGFSDHVGKV